MWVLASVFLTLYMRGDVDPSQMAFMLGESWMIGLGCVGQPMLTLYLLGSEPSPRACDRAATGAYTAAGLITVLLGVGQLHVDVLIGAFLLILPLAFAIQSGNASQALARRAGDRASAAAEGEERGWLACALAIGRSHQGRDAKLESMIDGADTAELRYDLEVFAHALDQRRALTHGAPASLRLINGTNGAAYPEQE